MMLSDGVYGVPQGKMAVVVTHLEMLSRPALRDITPPQGVRFRQITPTPQEYRALFNRVGTDWLWYGRLKLSDEALAATLDDPKVHTFTLTRDGIDSALMELDFRQDRHCELAYFGLAASLIGTGAGRYLMNEATTRAWAPGVSRFHVHTCSNDSAQALEFYRRSGFTAYKREVEIDDDPRLAGPLPRNAGAHIPIIE